MFISQIHNPSETANESKATPNIQAATSCIDIYTKNMATTHSSRLVIPNICIALISESLFLRFAICAMSRGSFSLRCFSTKVRMTFVYARNLLVYARSISDIAENNNEGVVKSIM